MIQGFPGNLKLSQMIYFIDTLEQNHRSKLKSKTLRCIFLSFTSAPIFIDSYSSQANVGMSFIGQ